MPPPTTLSTKSYYNILLHLDTTKKKSLLANYAYGGYWRYKAHELPYSLHVPPYAQSSMPPPTGPTNSHTPYTTRPTNSHTPYRPTNSLHVPPYAQSSMPPPTG